MVISPVVLGLVLLAVVALLALEGRVRGARRDDARVREQLGDPDGIVDRLRMGLRRRRFYLHLPSSRPAGRLPLVVALHGGHGNGTKLAAMTGFNAVADREGFAVVYPDADRRWNDGRDTTSGLADDVRFVRSLIEHLAARWPIDTARVYATGISSGGMMALRLACEAADVIAAFAAVNAAFPEAYAPSCRTDGPVSLLMINGTHDTFMPWNGGIVRSGRARGAGGRVISVPDTVAFWARHNGCAPRPVEGRPVNSVASDGTVARFLDFGPGRDGASLRMIRIERGGHTWPGSPLPLGPKAEMILGKTSYAIDGSEEIWGFFRDKRLARAEVALSA